jgi:hypothetical protein
MQELPICMACMQQRELLPKQRMTMPGAFTDARTLQ